MAQTAAGFDVWFKGGTSLTKRFGLIGRFSEDLNFKIEPGKLAPEVSGHVLLEVGSARVTPHVPRDITPWVHEKLAASGLGDSFDDNRALGVQCLHPFVTLLEQLDALHRRFMNDSVAPQTFIQCHEDAARLIVGADALPPLVGYDGVWALADEMVVHRQLVAMPSSDDVAFAPGNDARRSAIRHAHRAIAPMFWGGREYRSTMPVRRSVNGSASRLANRRAPRTPVRAVTARHKSTRLVDVGQPTSGVALLRDKVAVVGATVGCGCERAGDTPTGTGGGPH